MQFLHDNPQISTFQAVEDWAATQPDKAIQRLVESTVNFERLGQTYRNLIKDMRFNSTDRYLAESAPKQLLERAQRDGVSPERVRKTMQNIVQLLKIGHKYPDLQTATEFKTAAVLALRQAADPLIITQGAHPTCAIASLETSVYTHAPDAATKLVSEVLRTGKFVTTNGTTIEIDNLSLKPETRGLEANKTKFTAPKEAMAYRSYASQIFQTTAVNAFWQQRLTSPYNKNYSPPQEKNNATGMFRFETRIDTDASGKTESKDEIVDYHTGSRRVWKNGPAVTSFKMLEFMGRQIDKAAVPTVILDGAPEIQSRAAFVKHLNSLDPKQFPVIISVSRDRIIAPNSPKFELDHAVSILKSPQGKYLVHNTWRPYSDTHTPGKWIQNDFSLDHLMSAMLVP